MKKAIAAILSLFVGLFGYTIIDKATDDRLSELESSVSSLASVATSQEKEIASLKEFIKSEVYVITEFPSTEEEIIACYNRARKATGLIPDGSQKYEIISIQPDNNELPYSVISSQIYSAASKNTSLINRIPAANHPDISIDDVKTATATDDGKGNIVITINFKEQFDNYDGDPNNGGPVSRGIGSLGSIDSVCLDLGAEITEGKEASTLSYTDAYAKNIVISRKTGKIISGEWCYLSNIHVENIKCKMGISFSVYSMDVQAKYTANVYNLLDNT